MPRRRYTHAALAAWVRAGNRLPKHRPRDDWTVDRRNEVLRLRFCEGMTYVEIGRRFHFTTERARQIVLCTERRLVRAGVLVSDDPSS